MNSSTAISLTSEPPITLQTSSEMSGLWLRKMRMYYGISQKDLARQIGFSPSQLNRIEKGRRHLCLVTLKTLFRPVFEPEVEFFANMPQLDDGNQLAFGTLLRYVRTKCGISQGELGRRVGYSASAIHRIEKGTRRVTYNMVKQGFIPALTDCGDENLLSLLLNLALPK